MVKKIIYIFIFFCVFLNFVYSTELTVEPSVNKSQIYKDEYLEYTLLFKGNNVPKNIDIPKIPGFEIVSRHQENSGNVFYQSIVNGKVVQSFSGGTIKFYFTLKPVRHGKLSIGPFSFKLGSKNLQINRLNVEVINQKRFKDLSSELAAKINEPVFVISKLSKNECYLNEPVFVEYDIYYRVNLRFYKNPDFPDYKGFQPEKLFKNEFVENIHNRRFNVLKYRQMLYPVFKGKDNILTISSMVFPFVKNYDNFFGHGEKLDLRTKELKLKIKDLKNPTENFSGVVGRNLKISHRFSTENIKEEEAFILTIELSGEYNLKMAPSLKINFPESLEIYETSDSQQIHSSVTGLTGTKIYNYVIMPSKSGAYSLNTTSFEYYDLEKNKMMNLTHNIKFDIDPSQRKKKNNGTVMMLSNTGQTVLINDDNIKGIFFQNDVKEILFKKTDAVKILFLNFIPIVFYLVLLFYYFLRRKITGDESFAKRFTASKKAQKTLKTARNLFKDKKLKEGYSELYKVITRFISDRLNFEGYGLSVNDVENALKAQNIDSELLENIVSLLKKFDFKRFAPSNITNNEIEKDLSETLNLFSKLERLKLK
jgi:hypothetical protein